MVVEAEIRKTYRIKAKESPGIPAGHGRYLVTAEVVRLISGRDALPSRINYLVDVPFDSRGKLPKLKNELALLFLKRGPSPGQMVLTGPHSQIARTEEAARTNRRSEEHTSALQSLMRTSYAVFCLKKKTT